MPPSRRLLAALAVTCALAVGAPSANAKCGFGGPCGDLKLNLDLNFGPELAVGILGVSVDTLFAAMDLVRWAQDRRVGRVYGAIETVIAAPQLVYGLTQTSEEPAVWAFVGCMGVLTAHGVYAFVVGNDPETKPVTVVPTMAADGGGLSLAGRF
jgi:hypothetical protein